jgi:anti-sigma B factor antagonist
MSVPSAKLSVLVGEKFACVRIVGRANFTSSIDFRTVINELRKKDYAYFVVELSECVLMDSTFLGVLAGLGLQLGPAQPQNGQRRLELLNANPRIRELLETLGVLQLFRLTEGACAQSNQVEVISANGPAPTREEISRACLEAHQTLMAINPENIARFKDVTQFLAEDLSKLRT